MKRYLFLVAIAKVPYVSQRMHARTKHTDVRNRVTIAVLHYVLNHFDQVGEV